MRGRRWILPVTMTVLAAGALVFAIVATKESKHDSGAASTATSTTGSVTQPLTRGGFAGAELPRPLQAPAISLTDQYGRPVSLASFRGQPVVLTFLYTGCGGPCTLIAQQIRGALDELRRPIPVLIVSADPAGDTRVAVRRFLADTSLSGRVYYLTGSPEALGSVWRAYKARPASAGASDFASHATVLLIDPAGRERVLYGPEQLTPEALVHDIGKLQSG